MSIVLPSVVLLLTMPAAADKDKKYTLDDLRALIGDKHYTEALGHMTDIAPSERKDAWKQILAEAATGFAQSGRDAIDKLRNMLAVEEQFPTVVKDAKYAAVRTEWGPKGFATCFDESYDVSECKKFAIKFIEDDASNAKLALAMAKVARKGMNAYNAAPLFKRAVTASKNSACKDDDLSLSTIAALGLPKDHVDFADGKFVANSCFAELKPAIMKELADASGYYKDNACELLNAKKEKAAAGKLCAKTD